jgi:hypothetical protein
MERCPTHRSAARVSKTRSVTFVRGPPITPPSKLLGVGTRLSRTTEARKLVWSCLSQAWSPRATADEHREGCSSRVDREDAKNSEIEQHPRCGSKFAVDGAISVWFVLPSGLGLVHRQWSTSSDKQGISVVRRIALLEAIQTFGFGKRIRLIFFRTSGDPAAVADGEGRYRGGMKSRRTSKKEGMPCLCVIVARLRDTANHVRQ